MSGAAAVGAGTLLAGEGGAAALATAAEILSGPVGWTILAGTVIVGVALLNAHQKSEESLHDKAQDEPCASCGEVGCFNTPEGGDPEQMDRQLKEQQEAINGKSPDEILENLDKFDEYGRPDDAARRAAARKAARDAAHDAALTNALQAGKSPAEAEAEAEAAGDAAIEGKDATHVLDWVAGGDGMISGMGDSTINRSIGSQWKTRREHLRRAAEAAKKAGKKEMNIKLKKC